MSSKIADDEREQFALRLNDALRAAGLSDLALADFVREFNLRADGARVTRGAVRKWMVAEAIPTQERVHVLAKWLAVSSEWLRFGDGKQTAAIAAQLGANSKSLPTGDRVFLDDLRSLSTKDQALMRSLLDTLLAHRQPGM